MPDWLTFFLSFLHKPREAGTPFSCSTAVAKRMAAHIPHSDLNHPRNYLEIGPGTGVVTELLVQKLGPHDTLHIVEIEEGFFRLIKKKFAHDPRVRIHHADIANWDPGIQFDRIATGVPLNSLPSLSILKKILMAYERLAKPGAEMTAVEYVGTAAFGQCLKGEEFIKIVEIKKKFYQHHGATAQIEYRNIPLPARIYRLKITNKYFKD